MPWSQLGWVDSARPHGEGHRAGHRVATTELASPALHNRPQLVGRRVALAQKSWASPVLSPSYGSTSALIFQA